MKYKIELLLGVVIVLLSVIAVNTYQISHQLTHGYVSVDGSVSVEASDTRPLPVYTVEKPQDNTPSYWGGNQQ